MARFNVEDSIWTDPRFVDLSDKIGRIRAAGSLIYLWQAGQRYWRQDRSLIPENVFKKLEHCKDLLEAGLVEKRDEGYYCFGAKDHWDWLVKRLESAKKAGLASAAKRTSNINELGATKTQRQSTSSNPLTLTPTLTQKERIHIPISWGPMIEKLYEQKYPRKLGKKKGLEKLKRQIKTQDDFNQLSLAIDRYNEYLRKNKTETQYIKHFDTFVTSWTDWLDHNAGQTNLTDNKTGDLLRAISEREAYD